MNSLYNYVNVSSRNGRDPDRTNTLYSFNGGRVQTGVCPKLHFYRVLDTFTKCGMWIYNIPHFELVANFSSIWSENLDYLMEHRLPGLEKKVATTIVQDDSDSDWHNQDLYKVTGTMFMTQNKINNDIPLLTNTFFFKSTVTGACINNVHVHVLEKTHFSAG